MKCKRNVGEEPRKTHETDGRRGAEECRKRHER